jgi:membrane protein DedA with SNARE-associated domain
LVIGVLGLVIAPWLVWGSAVEAWAGKMLVDRQVPPYFGWWVVGLLAADVFLPIPSSIVAVAAGVFLGVGLGGVATFVGLTLGCMLGYACGFQWGPRTARKVVGERDWTRAERWAKRYGAMLVLVLRPVPVLAEASTFYAGASRVPAAWFFAASAVGNAVIAVVYVVVGSVSADSGDLEPALMAGFLLPGLAMLVVRLVSRKK